MLSGKSLKVQKGYISEGEQLVNKLKHERKPENILKQVNLANNISGYGKDKILNKNKNILGGFWGNELEKIDTGGVSEANAVNKNTFSSDATPPMFNVSGDDKSYVFTKYRG